MTDLKSRATIVDIEPTLTPNRALAEIALAKMRELGSERAKRPDAVGISAEMHLKIMEAVILARADAQDKGLPLNEVDFAVWKSIAQVVASIAVSVTHDLNTGDRLAFAGICLVTICNHCMDYVEKAESYSENQLFGTIPRAPSTAGRA